MGNLISKSLRHRYILTICFILAALFAVSCVEQGEVYLHYHQLKDGKWAQRDTMMFEIDSTIFELNKPYELSLEVTNNINYPYRNIWFFIQANINNDSVYTQISKEYEMADAHGKWNGSGFGSLYQISLPVQHITFKEKRNYRIKVEHGMRDEPLIGIEKVGVRLTDPNK